jgi:hypothetical protein
MESKRESALSQLPITTKQADADYCIFQQAVRESKRDSAINQVPITTKPEVLPNYGTKTLV